MLVVERPGVFLGKAHNLESWYVVDTTYAQFEKQVIAEWRERYRPTNRPGWVRPLASVGIPLAVLAALAAVVVFRPDSEWGIDFAIVLFAAVVALVVLLRLADHYWPGKPAVDGHIHAVVPIDRDVALAATDHTGWNDLWEVSVTLYRAWQAEHLGAVLDDYLEVLHSPEERKVITDARAAIAALAEKRIEQFNETTEWSTMFHKRLGMPDNGEY